MFDSLKYAKILEEAGVNREQAETHIRVLGSIIGDEMVTKKDLAVVHSDIKTEFAEFKLNLTNDFTEFKTDMTNEFAEFKLDITNEFAAFKTDMTNEFTKFKSDIRSDIQYDFNQFRDQLRQEVKSDITTAIEKSEYRIVIKLGSLMAALFTLSLTASQFIVG